MHAQNLSRHATQLTFGNGEQILLSYGTPVASKNLTGYHRTEKYWSRTTNRHIRDWIGGQSCDKIEQRSLNTMLAVAPR
jgi:hypothetical protein